MEPINRRQFVAGAAACACAACPLLDVLAAAAEPVAAAGPIDAGPLEHFTKPGVHDPLGPGRRFFLVNRAGRLYAVSATCTHRSVPLVASAGSFKCPRHGSGFDAAGHVTKSPARLPLPRFEIHLNENRHVIVNCSAGLREKDWEDPRAFVTMK